MENLIYILVGIAWVAYSLYSARQKAIQKQQASGIPPAGPSHSSPLPIPGNQSGGKNLFDEILRELSGEPRPVPQVSQPAVAVKSQNKKEASELNVKYEGSSGYKFISSVPADLSWHESENEIKTHVNEQQMTKNEDITKKFDLREAVIFSELLNRKYF